MYTSHITAFLSLFNFTPTAQEVAWFSGGRLGDGISDDRRATDEKYLQYLKKMKIARRGIRVLAHVPFVRAVFICNIFPVTVRSSSDMDVFVVVKHGRLWITRLLCTLALSIFGLRRRHGMHEDHVCLSFYVTDAHLDLTDIKKGDDVYLAYWVKTLLPVYDPENLLEVIHAKNQWANAFVVLDPPVALPQRQQVHARKIGTWLCDDWSERVAKLMQTKMMLKNKQSKLKEQTTDVIISDSMLKFHEHDRREEYAHAWRDILDS